MRLLKIGRDAGCDIVLPSNKVSSLHAEIILKDSGDIILEDKGSRNGTFVMNQPITPGKSVSIRRGDRICFADVELNWNQVPMPEDNSAYVALYGIGTHFDNDIQISGATVSRYHATIKVGRDGKVYLFDHSKNGTTVDGKKVMPNNPYRIKKSSAVVCGGVPVNLSTANIKWPTDIMSYLKWLGGAAAAILLLVGIGLGINNIIGGRNHSDEELFQKHKNAVCMLMGIYHYEVTIDDLDLDEFNQIVAYSFSSAGLSYSNSLIPKKLILMGEQLIDISEYSSKQLIEVFDKTGTYTGTGFFISPDGKLLTNLHVANPWHYDGCDPQQAITKRFAGAVEILNKIYTKTSFSAYISKVKVQGVLDYIALLPQGETFDPDNVIKCRVLSLGDNRQKDIALLQTVSKKLPNTSSTYIDVETLLDTEESSLNVGRHVLTIGFPRGCSFVQKEATETGIQAIAQGGNITQPPSEYDFSYNAPTAGGNSGAPVFNNKGKLIGIHHQGLSSQGIQGFNYGVRAKHIYDLLHNPYNTKVNLELEQ